MTKVLILGNCQARPMTGLLERTGLFTCLPPIVLHLAKQEEAEEHRARIAQADIILAQKTAPDFPLAHLRSDVLRAAHEGARIWPNIFYAGQQPFLRYFTHKSEGRLMGPLEATHDLRIYLRWRHARGLSVTDTLPPDYPERVARQSLIELLGREAGCDVTISDFIRAQNSGERLFFTFNHPTNRVLLEMARRLLAALDIGGEIPADPDAPEALSRYIVPSTWTEPGQTFRGDRYALGPDGQVARLPGHPENFSAGSIESAFFEIYDANPVYREGTTMRLTPAFDFDPVWS